MQNAGLDEAQAGIKIAGKISIISDMQMTPPLMAESEESDRGEWKSCVKLNIEKTKIIASGPITSLQMEKQWKQYETMFLGSKISADGDCSLEIKRCLLLGRKYMINLDSILESRDITLPTKVHLVKAMVFPVVCMYVRVGL